MKTCPACGEEHEDPNDFCNECIAEDEIEAMDYEG